MIDVMYFAWVRERIGLPRERVETSATTVAGLVEELVAPQGAATADLAGLAQQGPAAQQIGLQGQLHEARGFVAVGTLLQEQAHGGRLYGRPGHGGARTIGVPFPATASTMRMP